MKNRRRFILVPLAAAAVVLAFASVSFACTKLVGQLTTTPGSGATVAVGDNLTATGTNLNVRVDGGPPPGAPDGTKWSLYFLQHKSYQDGMKTCMGRGVGPTKEEKMGGAPTVTQSGNSVTVSGTFPNKPTRDPEPVGSDLGPAQVCLLSENAGGTPNYAYATNSAEFTVV